MSDSIAGGHGAPVTTIPGVLVRVHGCGLLLTGDCGAGKSDVALQLLERGHQLVADDAVELHQRDNRLHGSAPDNLAGLLEIRGLGPQCVAKLFGGQPLADHAPVDHIVRLVAPAVWADWPRLAPEQDQVTLLGHSVPRLSLPAPSERPLALLVEVVARLHAAGQLTGGTGHG